MTKQEILELMKFVFLTNDVTSELISMSSVVMDKDRYFRDYFSTKIATKLTEQLQYQGIVLENLYMAIDNAVDNNSLLTENSNDEIKKVRPIDG